MVQAGELIAGRYRLERPLARGGMGQLWVARHRALDAPVAIKLMAPALVTDPEARARFEREAKAAAALRSPHVVQTLDYGIDDGVPFIAMELLDGEDLSARLSREERLDLVTAARVVSQACKALELARELGIVHRDLKPANLFIARSGGDELVKILDFGVAAAKGRKADGFGSPHYMSPEQARGLPLDHRSDLWSLAVIAFRMVVGRRPFDGEDLGDVLSQITVEPLPRPSDVAGIAEDFDAFFARALARDPDERFASAELLAAAFCEVVAGLSGTPVALLRTVGPAVSSTERPQTGTSPATAPTARRATAPSSDDATLPTSAPSHDTLTVATRETPASPPRRASRALIVAAIALAIGSVALWRGREQPAQAAQRLPIPLWLDVRAPPPVGPPPAPAATALPSASASAIAPSHAAPRSSAERHEILGY